MLDLTGKVALVTGGSRGIGRAIAETLARQGAAVVINYQSNATAAQEVVDAIVAAGGQARAVQGDVRDSAAAQAMVKSATTDFGRLDILVNNAGTTRDTLLPMMKEEDWDTVMELAAKLRAQPGANVQLRALSTAGRYLLSAGGVAAERGFELLCDTATTACLQGQIDEAIADLTILQAAVTKNTGSEVRGAVADVQATIDAAIDQIITLRRSPAGGGASGNQVSRVA